jgi:hypothetical protein
MDGRAAALIGHLIVLATAWLECPARQSSANRSTIVDTYQYEEANFFLELTGASVAQASYSSCCSLLLSAVLAKREPLCHELA